MAHVSGQMKATLPLMLAAALNAGAADIPEAQDYADLIRGLSSESFQDREKATGDLWEAGPGALEELREASRSDDPETALRAAAVLEKIELRITPETPGTILELIRKYRSANKEQKPNILNELKRKKAYYQVLKLYAMQDPEVRAEMIGSVRGVAIAGARQAIVAGENEEALELLRMSANEPNDLMALACAYLSMGRLAEGAEDPPAPDNVPTEVWKITLLRAKGDIAAAAKLAEESKQAELLAALKVLTGDPTLWLRGNGFGESDLGALDAYVDIALTRWNGGKPKESDFAELQEMVKSKDDDEGSQAMASLAALGRLPEIEKVQAADDPELGFQYYLSQERIPEALEVIGLDPEKPDFTAWAAERFQKLNDGEGNHADHGGPAEAQLQMLAVFMGQRGMEKEFAAAFAKPLGELAEADEESFLEFLRPLFLAGVGAPEFALETGAVWAGDDRQRWSRLTSIAFGEEDETMAWLAWIRKIEPEIGEADTMKAMMALFGIGMDAGHLRRKWMDSFFETAEKSEDDEGAKHIRRIIGLAVAMNDVESALRARDMLKPEERESVSWSSMTQFLSAAGRWKDAAGVISESSGSISSSPEFHAVLAATFRKAGFEEKAAEHDGWVEKLALGYAPSCNRIGDNYMYGGDRARAAKWYERAAFQADIKGEFVAVLDNHAHAMLWKGESGIAASCYEALAQAYVSQRFSGGAVSEYSKARLSADLAKALAILPEDRARAIALLDDIHRIYATDGVLADDFFPLVRKAGLDKELDRWFAASWARMTSVLARFPDCDNSKNTAGWLASRAGKKLAEAEKYLSSALARNPDQAAYLDTMAELHFAKGDRKGAVEWSGRALMHYPLTDRPYDAMIRKQHERFLNDPLP